MSQLDIEISELRREENFATIIQRVREEVAADCTSTMSNWQVKEWCGFRWRNLFVTEAVKDKVALKAARKHLTHSPRRRIAEAFLRGCGRDEWMIELPEATPVGISDTAFVFCPGLLNGLLPVRAFQTALPEVESQFACQIIRADLHPLAGCEANSLDLADAIEHGKGLRADRSLIEDEKATPPGDVFLMGYSKGVPDILTLLVNRPDLAPRIKCIFGWAGAGGGSYVAEDVWNSLKSVKEDPKLLAKLVESLSPVAELPEIVSRRQGETDIRTAVRDLTSSYRGEFLRKHEVAINSLGIPIFNLTGSTTITKAPTFQMQGVARINGYDSNNDMQVSQDQARIQMPMATDLAMLNGHHWDLSYEAFPKNLRLASPHLNHPFPKKAALVANFQLASELGLIS